MGLSTTAAYGIIFTASLFMLGVLLNSILFSFYLANDGMQDRFTLMEGQKNTIKIDRIVYNESRVEIIAENLGPMTISINDTSFLLNGTLSTLQSSGDNMWYPGVKRIFFSDKHTYSYGDVHDIQFTIAPASTIISTAVLDKVYAITDTELIAYSFEGVKLWSVSLSSTPVDLCVGKYVYVSTPTGVFMYTKSGAYAGFFANITDAKIDCNKDYVYAVNSTEFIVYNSTGSVISTDNRGGRDVCIGDRVYVLTRTRVRIYNLTGTYLGFFTSALLTDPLKISADWNMESDTVFVLNNGDEIIVFKNGTYEDTIPLSTVESNIEIYGKIYLSGTGITAMDMGYRIKIVDEYGNSFYDFM